MTKEIKARLEYLRGEILNERISYGEVAELQDLAEYIDAGDVLLLEWAGVPEMAEKITVRFVKPRGWDEPLAVFMGKRADRRYATYHRDGMTVWGEWVRACYQHTGQHGECTDHFLRAKRATVEEYTPLLKELESLGYSVTVK